MRPSACSMSYLMMTASWSPVIPGLPSGIHPSQNAMMQCRLYKAALHSLLLRTPQLVQVDLLDQGRFMLLQAVPVS